MIWSRKCPKCSKEIIYSRKDGLVRAIKTNTPCYSCSRTGRIPVPIEKRFWSYVQKPIGEGCWLWTGAIDGGYGRMTVNKKGIYAHRISYMLHKGNIPDTIKVCHTCDNPLCVRIDHLYLGTQQDNMDDRDNKGRCAKGETSGMSKLTEEQVKTIKHTPYYWGMNTALAKCFGLNQGTVSCIRRGITWKHIT
jgi:hypothetical protein